MFCKEDLQTFSARASKVDEHLSRLMLVVLRVVCLWCTLFLIPRTVASVWIVDVVVGVQFSSRRCVHPREFSCSIILSTGDGFVGSLY